MHRDIKPANIVWDANNKVWKIIDLGFSKIYDGDSNGDHTYLGTPVTMAPEFFKNTNGKSKIPYCNKIDVWSLGVVYYFIVTGKYLFEFKNKDYMGEFKRKI